MAFWSDIQAEIRKQLDEVRPRVMLVDATANGLVQLRAITETAGTGSGEAYATLGGRLDLHQNDEVVCLRVGGKWLILDQLQRVDPASYSYPVPIIAPNFNSPYIPQPIVANSATLGSILFDGVTYAENVGGSIVLPTGTWTVMAWGGGMYSHSVANGIVRTRLLIQSDQGTALTMTCPLSSTRTWMGNTNMAAGLSGTVTLSLGYRANASGTASAGGGWVSAIAFRTS